MKTRRLRPEATVVPEPTFDEVLDMPLSQTGLCIRTVNQLEAKGHFTVRSILMLRPAQVLEIPNFGHKTLQQIYEALERLHPRLRRKPKEQRDVA